MCKALKDMKEAIVNAKELTLNENPFYWYSQLDYTSDKSHPEYSILSDMVKRDLEVIRKGDEMRRKYIRIGAYVNDLHMMNDNGVNDAKESN